VPSTFGLLVRKGASRWLDAWTGANAPAMTKPEIVAASQTLLRFIFFVIRISCLVDGILQESS
jgi:hypothetical protein